MKTILIFITILFIADSAYTQNIGKTAPLFTGKSIEGDTIKLLDYREKVTLLDFWASWCKPCKEEFPFLIELYNEYSEKGFSVLAVNLDNESGNQKKFIDNLGKEIPFKIIHDNDSKIPVLYNIDAMPSVFLIDKNGVIRSVHVGFKSKDKNIYRNEIEKILNEK